MCGIAGFVALRANMARPPREALVQMASALTHRGPDEFGIYLDETAGLASARLSIIDLATGQQPLCDQSGSLWIVFNGEIFNYRELRDELIALGYTFRTGSDTEVFVQAYHAWGDDAFERFNGQWAAAIWDSVAGRLVLSRDRAAICPLYYCEIGGRLYFASEAKAIFAADAQIRRAFDPAGIDQTFTFWSAVPPQGVFAGISEVEPGQVRTYENGTVRDQAFWRPAYEGVGGSRRFDGSLDEAVEEVRGALDRATSLRVLRADVPVGSYLSGGLDSSLVAALGRRMVSGGFHTFSLRFDDAEYDETEFQRLMARAIGSDHHELVVSHQDIAEAFPKVLYHAERPLLRTAAAPMFLLSGLARQHGIKVVLTGEGADEVFAGYDLFREGKVRRFWARQPGSTLRPRLLERLYPYLARSPVAQQAIARQFFGRGLDGAQRPGFAHGPRWHTTSALKRLFSSDLRSELAGRDQAATLLDDLPPELREWSRLAQDQYIEIRTLLSGYLLSSQGDRMLMAHSVEGRFPFLDNDVVALANSLPPSYKLNVLDEKHVLKRVAGNAVPPSIVARKKQPFRAPDAVAFLTSTPPAFVDEVLSETALRDANIFDPLAVAQLVAKCRSSDEGRALSNSDNMAIVGVLSTQLLHQQFVKDRPSGLSRVTLRTDIDRTLQAAS